MKKKKQKKVNSPRDIIISVFIIVVAITISYLILHNSKDQILASPGVALSPGAMLFSFTMAFVTMVIIGIVVYYILVNKRSKEN